MGEIQFSYRGKIVTIAIVVSLAAVFLYAVRGLLTPLVWAAIVAYVFNPFTCTFSCKTRLHRFWGVALLYAIMVGVVFGFVIYVIPPLRFESQQLSHNLPRLVRQIYYDLFGAGPISLWGFQVDEVSTTEQITAALQRIGSTAQSYMLPVFFGVLGFITKLLLFFLALFYFLLDADRIGRAARDVLPEPIREEVLWLGAEIDHVLGRWVRGELTLILIMTVATWLGLSVLGVHYAILLALMTGFMELFPILGPVVAGVIACTVALFQPNHFGWSSITFVAVVAGLYFFLRYAEDYFVIPNVIGRIVEFHPLAVVFAVLAGGSLAGVLGMFIAAPALAILKVTLRYLYAKLTDAPLPMGVSSEEIKAEEPQPSRPVALKQVG